MPTVATHAKAPQEPLNTKNGSVGYSTQCAAVTAPDDTEMPGAKLVAKTGPSTWLLQLSLASILGGEQPAGTISDKRKSVCCAVPLPGTLGLSRNRDSLGSVGIT